MTGSVVNWPAPPPLFAGDREPSTVAELESALNLVLIDATTELMHGALYAPRSSAATSGPPLSEAVQRLSVTFDWDMYHERPCQTVADVRWRSLREYTVLFQLDWGLCAARLQQRYGAPRAVSQHYESRVFTYFVYGPFFVAPYGARGFSLTYYKKIPDWALAPADDSLKGRFLQGFAHALANAQGPSDALTAASIPPPGCGVLARERTSHADFRLELAPAIPALELARIWGWHDAIAESTGVHMSSWYVKLVSRSATEFSTRLPAFGHWQIEALLDTGPSGEDVAGAPVGPWGHRHLTSKDTVRHLSITGRGVAGV